MTSNPVKVAMCISPRADTNALKPSYVVGTEDEIEALIDNMTAYPQPFIERHIKETSLTVYPGDKVKLKITKRARPKSIQFDGEDISVIATAKYRINYRQAWYDYIPSLPWLVWFPTACVLTGAGLLAILTIFWGLVLQQTSAEIEEIPECTLIIKNGQPIGVDVWGDLLYYNKAGHVDPIWEGTALPEQLRMAYHPMDSGCAVIHITE